MMKGIAADLASLIRSPLFWRSAVRLVLLIAVALAVIVAVLTAFVVLVPIAVIGGVALRSYLKRRPRHPVRTDRVIEGDYTVIER
jgi:hypothetical protein